jgi:hypothetical protein
VPQAPTVRSFSPAPATSFTPAPRVAAPSFGTSAAAAAPARAEIKTAPAPAAAAPPATVAASPEPEREIEATPETAAAETKATGITPEQVAEIKTAIQAQQKFLGEIMNQGNRWELEGAELRIYFSADKRAFAEMMEGRDSLEKVRASSSKVLGRPVRVCAKVEAVAANAPRGISGTQELREQFERDPMVRSMLQRFGGKISEVKCQEES